MYEKLKEKSKGGMITQKQLFNCLALSYHVRKEKRFFVLKELEMLGMIKYTEKKIALINIDAPKLVEKRIFEVKKSI